MKTLFSSLLLLSLTTVALADEARAYKKIDSTTAQIVITDDEDDTQAVAFVDGKEIDQFLQDLLSDPESELYKVARSIEKENCSTGGEPNEPEEVVLEGCGEVTLTPTVVTSFGRGGWQSAGATYTLFIGFTADGTGHYFDSSYMIKVDEDVEAQVDENEEFNHKVIKTLKLEKIKKLETEEAK